MEFKFKSGVERRADLIDRLEEVAGQPVKLKLPNRTILVKKVVVVNGPFHTRYDDHPVIILNSKGLREGRDYLKVVTDHGVYLTVHSGKLLVLKETGQGEAEGYIVKPQ